MRKPEGTPELRPPPIAVSPAEWTAVRAILGRHLQGHTVWAFGSRASGQAKPYSDLDLAIDPPLPAAEMDALREAFRESPL
ncbi:MAG: nucleotidyltransferase domain-containing protein, partial [Nitrospirae bacterium]